MNVLALTPEEFQTTALSWVGAVTAVVTGAAIAAAVLLPKLAALKAQVETLFRLHGQNSSNITTLAIATPPPAAAPAQATAEVAQAIEENTAATKANTQAQLSDEPPANPPQ